MDRGQAEEGHGLRKNIIERERHKKMGKVGVLAEKAPVLSSSRIDETVTVNEIGQRLLKIDEVGVAIIKIIVQVSVVGMDKTEGDR